MGVAIGGRFHSSLRIARCLVKLNRSGGAEATGNILRNEVTVCLLVLPLSAEWGLLSHTKCRTSFTESGALAQILFFARGRNVHWGMPAYEPPSRVIDAMKEEAVGGDQRPICRLDPAVRVNRIDSS